MYDKTPVSLTKEEIISCSDFQKKCIEAFAELTFKHNLESNFKIFGVGICIVISNLMASLGIKNTNDFINDLTDNLKRTHTIIQKNASYMEYKNGEKISEGNFN